MDLTTSRRQKRPYHTLKTVFRFYLIITYMYSPLFSVFNKDSSKTDARDNGCYMLQRYVSFRSLYFLSLSSIRFDEKNIFITHIRTLLPHCSYNRITELVQVVYKQLLWSNFVKELGFLDLLKIYRILDSFSFFFFFLFSFFPIITKSFFSKSFLHDSNRNICK